MSLPNYLARIKSSGIYRYVWDKSVVPTQVAETLRLVVGYSDKGPFNTPVYIDKVSDFIDTFGGISKKMERKGIFFNRMAIQALAAGPILALNLKPFKTETIDWIGFDTKDINSAVVTADTKQIKDVYDRNRFWKLDADQLPAKLASGKYVNIAATDNLSQSCTLYMRKSKFASEYDLTIRQYFSNGAGNGYIPEYLEPYADKKLCDFFVDVYVFRGQITEAVAKAPGVLSNYFDQGAAAAHVTSDTGESKSKSSSPTVLSEVPFKIKLATGKKDTFGRDLDTLDALANDPNSNFVAKYTGCIIPYFKNANGKYVSIDVLFNADYYLHKMLMKLNDGLIYDVDGYTTTNLDKFLALPKEANLENIYLKGYTYKLTGSDEADIQKNILAMLNDGGIYEALTNRTDVEYRYIVDTFQSYVQLGCKSQLAAIAREKDNAFALLNFPPMDLFIKDGNFKTGDKFDIKKLADGAHFSLPSEIEGASWCGFFTNVKFSDGTLKSNVPSAALVSNNFMEKYGPRQPYYIVAGPNYGRIGYSGMVGPDYNYSRSDLDVLEPMGVNAIIYVPRKGTFINSNQTAKQVPVSGLSKIHIRELVIYLQDEIEAMLQDYQWELNTQALRDVIKAKADTICERVMNNGGLYAFVNVCDETNNTPEVIDNEMIILDTAIEPARGAGKMVQTLTIHKTGGITTK